MVVRFHVAVNVIHDASSSCCLHGLPCFAMLYTTFNRIDATENDTPLLRSSNMFSTLDSQAVIQRFELHKHVATVITFTFGTIRLREGVPTPYGPLTWGSAYLRCCTPQRLARVQHGSSSCPWQYLGQTVIALGSRHPILDYLEVRQHMPRRATRVISKAIDTFPLHRSINDCSYLMLTVWQRGACLKGSLRLKLMGSPVAVEPNLSQGSMRTLEGTILPN
jgi:hypothetical protein